MNALHKRYFLDTLSKGNMAGNILDNFVVIEGLDGSGTTTQLTMLKSQLTKKAVPHFCTFEPTDRPIGRMLRSILKQEIAVHPRTTALLFAADRNEHLYEPGNGILERIGRGEVVICDRYLFSSLAYQGVLIDYSYVAALNEPYPLPSHLFFIDLPVETSQKRIMARKEIHEPELFDHIDLQKRVLSEGYYRILDMYKDSGMSIHRIDGRASPQEIFERLWAIIGSLPIPKR